MNTAYRQKRMPSRGLHHDPRAIERMLSLTRMTKTQLHQETGISLSLICEIVNGTRNATPKNLGLIADAFNCPVTMLEAQDPPTSEQITSATHPPVGWEPADAEMQRLFTPTMAEGPGAALHENVDVWATWTKGAGITITVDMPISAPQFTFEEIKRMHADMGEFIQQIEGALR